MPAFQAIVPQLVPREELQAAITLNGIGINISRAVGPALAGVLITAYGIGLPFLLNALSFLAVLAVIWSWRPPAGRPSPLPAERFLGAVRAGWRFARGSAPLRATLVRSAGFFLFASAFWALLPLVAREVLAGGPELYGAILASVGVGAVGGAFILERLRRALGHDRLVAAGTFGTSLALAALALGRQPALACAAGVLAGLSWIAVLSSLNVSAQLALPDWVRARGLAVHLTVFMGAMSLGGLIWRQVAASSSVPAAQLLAALGALAAVPLTWRHKLAQGAGMDLAPSMHWPQPMVAEGLAVERDAGPVMVQVEYRIAPEDDAAFAALIAALGRSRRRDGALFWGMFTDAEDPARRIELFLVESWLEHLRQHERVTGEERGLQERLRALHRGEKRPKVTHAVTGLLPHAAADG